MKAFTRRLCLVLPLAAALLFSGCAPALPEPEPEPAPAAAVPARRQDPDTLAAAVFYTELTQQVHELQLKLPVFGSMQELFLYDRDALQQLPIFLRSAVASAFQSTCDILHRRGHLDRSAFTDDWKLLTAILWSYPESDYTRLLSRCVNVTLHVQKGELFAKLRPVPCYEVIQGSNSESAMACVFSYAYFNTVYDENGEEKPFEQYPMSEDYIAALQDPLPGHAIRDSWYNSRSKGTRKHTGTDIRAKAGTEILSCTDGTVQFLGFNDTAGNYIVVLDDEGFAYHYYHMIEPTDFLQVGDRVQKGDVVGHVGNTGNSDANHLHLTIISPAYTYINPYPVLQTMRSLQAR